MRDTFHAVLTEPLEGGQFVSFRRPVHRRGRTSFVAVLVQPFHLSPGEQVLDSSRGAFRRGSRTRRRGVSPTDGRYCAREGGASVLLFASNKLSPRRCGQALRRGPSPSRCTLLVGAGATIAPDIKFSGGTKKGRPKKQKESPTSSARPADGNLAATVERLLHTEMPQAQTTMRKGAGWVDERALQSREFTLCADSRCL